MGAEAEIVRHCRRGHGDVGHVGVTDEDRNAGGNRLLNGRRDRGGIGGRDEDRGRLCLDEGKDLVGLLLDVVIGVGDRQLAAQTLDGVLVAVDDVAAGFPDGPAERGTEGLFGILRPGEFRAGQCGGDGGRGGCRKQAAPRQAEAAGIVDEFRLLVVFSHFHPPKIGRSRPGSICLCRTEPPSGRSGRQSPQAAWRRMSR